MSTTRNGKVIRRMPGDARHPKKYPRGPKHPKLQVTPEWKALVLTRLAENKSSDRPPRTPAELARMVGADKGGLHEMLYSAQDSYKYARPISKLLSIGEPVVANPALTEDEWDAYARELRQLPKEKQKLALETLRSILRTFGVDGAQ